MTHKNIFFLTIFLIISSCSSSKLEQFFKEGTVLETDFLTSIPLNIKNGHIVVEATINNATYNFILDTGATNVISEKLAEELNVNILGTEKVSDIKGDIQDMNFAEIESITLGETQFSNTIVGISNFTEIYPYNCFQVDGIIGANLMQLAIWDIDFENKVIRITDQESKLNLPEKIKESKIYIGYGGVSSVTAFVNNTKIYNYTIDFGFDGGIVIPYSEVENQIEDGRIQNFVKGYGDMPIGAFGESDKNNFFIAKIDEYRFGDIIAKNRITYSDETTTHRIGLDFFKDYRVILNWNKKRIKMIGNQNTTEETYSSYGFDTFQENNKIIISSLIEGSNASKYLEIGDQVLRIDDKDFSHITENERCENYEEGLIDKSIEEINITVLRNKEVFNYILEKTSFF